MSTKLISTAPSSLPGRQRLGHSRIAVVVCENLHIPIIWIKQIGGTRITTFNQFVCKECIHFTRENQYQNCGFLYLSVVYFLVIVLLRIIISMCVVILRLYILFHLSCMVFITGYYVFCLTQL